MVTTLLPARRSVQLFGPKYLLSLRKSRAEQDGDVGLVLFYTPLRGGSWSGLGSASSFFALFEPADQQFHNKNRRETSIFN